MKDKETSEKNGLKNKRIVLLGGTSGFGFGAALAAAEEGAEIVVVSSTQQRIDKALASLPSGSEGYTADLTNEGQVVDLFKKIGEFDHLIFTAGETLQLNELSTVNMDDARQFFNLRFWGALMAAKYGSQYIRKGGSITLTSGVVGLRPMKGWSVTASIAGAIHSLTRALAIDLAPIRVNTVCGGVVKTDLWANMPEEQREAFYEEVGNKMLTGRVGEAEDIAEAYLYLMKGNFTTGQIIVVDGGAVLV